MKIGIIGLAGSGKATVFDALTGEISGPEHKMENRVGTKPAPDGRVDALSRMYNPKKTTYAQVEYYLPGSTGQKKDEGAWTQVRDADALIMAVRNFSVYGLEPPRPRDDFRKLDQELIFSDLVVTEKRLERLEADRRRGKEVKQEELSLLIECKTALDAETPLRKFPHLARAPLLRGFAFLSAKPLLVLFNNDDEDDGLPEVGDLGAREECQVIRGKLERELGQMSPEEAAEFLTEFGITSSALDRVIKKSYEIMGLISFFTVGEDEVKAWTIRRGTPALEAAGAIHSDIQKGFIRAEVVGYDDLIAAGSLNEAKKRATLRLEGKTYEVQDGDVVHFRFNV
ncbi:MAG: DUF933 domain-containing protein [Pseudomonadota bacterium]